MTDDGTGRGLSRRVRLILRLVGVVAILGMTLYLLWRDERPPADADLRNYRRNVKDEENGFRLVDLSESDVAWPLTEDEEPLVESESATFDREKAAEISRRNASLFEKVDRALALPDFQLDAVEHIDVLVPHLLAWRSLALALASRSRLRMEEGRPAEAYEDTLRLIRLGGRIQRAQGTIIECLVGMDIQRMGIRRLLYLSVHGQLPARVQRRGIEELQTEVRRNDLADVFKAQYVMLANTFDLYAAGKITGFAPGPTFLMKPNQTRRLLGEKIRGWIERDAIPPHARKAFDDSDMEYPSTLEVYLLRGAGRKALNWWLGSSRAEKQADTAHWTLAATRALLALTAFRTEKGALPDSLQALVPGYLDAVPLDPYTGKQFLYSAAKMLLYSPGPGGFDYGGSPKEDAWLALTDLDQPTLRLDPTAWKLDIPEGQAEASEETEAE